MIKLAEKKTFDNEFACKAARLGYKYDDKIHVYYQILNGVSYSFQTFSSYKCPSKNNEEGISSQMDF